MILVRNRSIPTLTDSFPLIRYLSFSDWCDLLWTHKHDKNFVIDLVNEKVANIPRIREECLHEDKTIEQTSLDLENVFVRLWGAQSEYHRKHARDINIERKKEFILDDEEDDEMTEEEKGFLRKQKEERMLAKAALNKSEKRVEVSLFTRNAFLPLASSRWVESMSLAFQNRLWSLDTFNHCAPFGISGFRFVAKVTEAELKDCRKRALDDILELPNVKLPFKTDRVNFPPMQEIGPSKCPRPEPFIAMKGNAPPRNPNAMNELKKIWNYGRLYFKCKCTLVSDTDYGASPAWFNHLLWSSQAEESCNIWARGGCSGVEAIHRRSAGKDDIDGRHDNCNALSQGTITGGAGTSGTGGSAGGGFIAQSEREMAKLRQGNVVWNFVTKGQHVGNQAKMHGDRKLRCNFCGHLFQGNAGKATRHFTQSKQCKAAGMRVLAEIWNDTNYTFKPATTRWVQRWMADEGVRDTRVAAGAQQQRMDEEESGERDDVQDALDEEEGLKGGVGEGGKADEAVGDPHLPGEEVVMTSRGVSRAGPAPRAPRAKLESARREKRPVGEGDVEVRETAREKRARQTTIDEMYDKENLAEFHDAWLQWIYTKGLAFNAFRGPEFQRVRRAAERVPRTVQFRFPSYRVTAGTEIPSQRGKVASMVSEVRSAFCHTGATILSDGRKARSGKPLVNFLVGGANGALLYATVARDGSVRDTADIVYRRWRAIILSFPAKDVIGFCTDSASNYTAAARRFATDPDADIRRITWLTCPTHVCNLMLSDVGTRVAWVKETIIRARALVRFIKSHGAAFAVFRRMSPRVTLVEPVETRFALVFLMLTCLKGRRDALGSMLHGDAWARIPWERRLVSLAQWQGRGYVLPWVMGTGQEETAGGQEDDEGDVDSEVWGARPAGSFSEHDIEHHVVAFHACRPSRADPVQDVFGKRAVEPRSWPEQTSDADGDGDTSDDEWTDDDEAPVSGDATAERVYFTYGGGPDGMTPHTSVITYDHVEEQEPVGGLRQMDRRWEVRSDSEPEGAEEEEEVGLRDRRFSPSHHRTTGAPEPTRPRTRSASAAERQQTPATEHHEGTGLAEFPEMERTPSGVGVRHRSPSELRTNDFYVGGSSGGLGNLSASRQRGASLSDVLLDDSDVRGHVDRGGAGCPTRQRGGGAAADFAGMGWSFRVYGGAAPTEGGVPTGVEEDGVPTGVEGDGGGEDEEGDGGGEDEDEDEEGSDHGDDGSDGDDGGDHGDDDDYDGNHGDDGDDGDHDGNHDDEGRLALVLRDPSVPTLPLTRPEAFAQAGFDAEDLARLGSHDPFPHTGRRSDERRPPGGAYSPPPYIVDSPRWSGSSLSGIRGREFGPVDGGSAGSMPPPPARSTEGGAGMTTACAPVAGSPPPVAGGVASGWAAHRRVSDRMRADYDAGRGAFAGRLSPRFQVAASSEGGSGRPSVHMAGCMLGLSRSATRRVFIPPPIPARGTAADMQQGQHYTSGEEGLPMRSGSRRHSTVTEVEARLAAEIATGQAALDAIQRQRQTIAAAEAEDEDADTEFEPIDIAVRRHRAVVSAAATVAQAAYISGA
ncbi:hypothetical protein CBR_g55430 [Chara braunii]|uniref:DUF659 domain-containing protein n=1 Tax=Chara braunii TaxID=69332 RepID=A0A388K7S5_CHABU|nr:hypothetical protein CBR_g55430 [Chara braunii]|eukprot:GBG66087.1 hypothetical protein CBR_g55430 [Chara braunii]